MYREETKTLFISKYALTSGVEERNCLINETFDSAKYGLDYFRIGKDAHETREAAVAAAEKMRVAKIASLEKQLKKLRTMTFN